jgi:hypothetical protein
VPDVNPAALKNNAPIFLIPNGTTMQIITRKAWLKRKVIKPDSPGIIGNR